MRALQTVFKAVILVPIITASPIAQGSQPPICGPRANNATCERSPFGPCCSTSGFCGSGLPYCGAGNCISGPCSGDLDKVTQDGTCGADHNDWICGDREWGPCCSNYGYCGSDKAHCGVGVCYSGPCEVEGAPGGPSLDGTCGPNFANNRTCPGSGFGDCCSNYGYCGSSVGYCGLGNCYSGECDTAALASAPSIALPAPISTPVVELPAVVDEPIIEAPLNTTKSTTRARASTASTQAGQTSAPKVVAPPGSGLMRPPWAVQVGSLPGFGEKKAEDQVGLVDAEDEYEGDGDGENMFERIWGSVLGFWWPPPNGRGF